MRKLLSYLDQALQYLDIVLSHNQLERGQAVIVHAQTELGQLDQIVTTRLGRVPARMAVPLTNITNDARRSCRRFLHCSGQAGSSSFEGTNARATV